MSDLKNKIVKINLYSILLIVLIFAIVNFITVDYVLNETYQKEKNFTKQEYLISQKMIIKNQINNFINFIIHTQKNVKKEKLKYLIHNIQALSKVLQVVNPSKFKYIFEAYSLANKNILVGLSDLNGNMIFSNTKDCSTKERKRIIKYKIYNKIIVRNTKIGKKFIYLIKFTNKINHKTYIIGNGIYESTIIKEAQNIILNRVNSIKYGAKEHGYISIAKILNYKGGKKFAKVVAIPIRPSWVGKYLNDNRKDAKGKMYRKAYLKIINTKGQGYVRYWFYKKDIKKARPKLSYVKLYKPYNWMIVTGIYLDDIHALIAKTELATKYEIRKIFVIYLFVLIIFLIIAYIVGRYENKILYSMIESYENIITDKNKELENINKNLEKEVKEKTDALLQSLLKDKLTNLPNREKLLMDMEDNDEYLAILNIDSFKEINDFYGLDVGDEVLRTLAFILSHSSQNDIYKLAADEFAIVSHDLDSLKSNIENLIFILSNTSMHIYKYNINISLTSGIGHTFPQADMALKYAKKIKNKNIVVFDEESKIQEEYQNNLKWKNIIFNAIKEDKILPFVQPIINNKTQKIEKFECLVRLEYNDRIYSPYFFLDISKHTKQYHNIQKIMIQKTFEKFSVLNYKFSINLSTLDLTNESLKQFLLKQIDKYNVSNKLIVELLEDEELISDEITEFLDILKSKNIEIAIDDFGSGYSNFSYLIQKLSLSILKIDGSLIKNIVNNEKDYRLLKTIVNMAKEFNFEIVAEFVENKEIFKILQKLGVDYSQGYYFSKPFDIRELKN